MNTQSDITSPTKGAMPQMVLISLADLLIWHDELAEATTFISAAHHLAEIESGPINNEIILVSRLAKEDVQSVIDQIADLTKSLREQRA